MIITYLSVLIVAGEKSGELVRKGSAGRTRSKFFPNGWTNQDPTTTVTASGDNIATHSNTHGKLTQPPTQRTPPAVQITDETEIVNQKATKLSNQNDFLSSSLPSSFFKKSK